MLPETSSARDGIDNDRPTKLAGSGMKQPSETRREYHMTLELPLNVFLKTLDDNTGKVSCGDCLR
jgi:hypothetical protein